MLMHFAIYEYIFLLSERKTFSIVSSLRLFKLKFTVLLGRIFCQLYVIKVWLNSKQRLFKRFRLTFSMPTKARNLTFPDPILIKTSCPFFENFG